MDIFSSFILTLSHDLANFYHSGTFAVIKFFIGIYVLVLIIDIILLLFQRPLGGDFRETILGVDVPKELISKRKTLKLKWDKILKRLESGNESEYKVSIIEADNLLDDLVTRLGYKGDNLGSKLASIPEGQLENVDRIKAAHETRNRVIHEENFSLSKEEAKKVLDDFAELLHYFQVLD